MKNGRHAPCPRGSGKKFKKCCLDKNVTPPETLQLKLDRPLGRKTGTFSSNQLAVRIAQIKDRIAEFGDKRLHDTYTGFAASLCDAVAKNDLLNIHRGRIEIWAAAIVSAIARLNHLFSRETTHCLTPDELCDWFKVKKTTVSSNAAMVRKALDLYYDLSIDKNSRSISANLGLNVFIKNLTTQFDNAKSTKSCINKDIEKGQSVYGFSKSKG